MRIIYIDRKDKPGEYAAERAKQVCELLRQKGHTVDSGRTIADIVDEGQDISSYDLAICRPYNFDARILNEEMGKRKNFYVILNSPEPEEYSLNSYQDGQLYALRGVLIERMFEVIEKIQENLTESPNTQPLK